MRPVVPVILALLAVLLVVGTLRAKPDDGYRVERFSYRVNPPKHHPYEAFFTPELENPRTPAFYEELVLEPGDYAPPTAEELGERLWSYNRTYDAFGDPYLYPFNHDEWSERVANLRLREQTYAHEADEGLIGDIAIDWLATTLKITGRKLFVLGYTSKTYVNPPDPLLVGTQGNFNMDQETQIRVEGTIAQRVTVNVDYDDTRENDSRNKLSLLYTGREDELIRQAELGDIALSIPGTRFVSYSAKSLFGAKVIGGLGDWFTFTLIGSREKGITEEEEFTGTGQLQRQDLRDTSYSERLYYRVDTNPAHFGQELQIAESPIDGSALIEIYVYSYGHERDPTYTYYSLDARIYSDGEGGSPTNPPVPTGDPPVSSDFWRRLENVRDFYINKATGRVTFTTSVGTTDYVAIKYKVANPSNPTGVIYSVGYGEGATADPKLVKSGINNPILTDYMYHDVYYLGAMGLQNDSDFIMEIFDLQDRANDAEDFDGDGNTTEPLVRVFGLTRASDGSDDRININYIDFAGGLLIFPDRYPFQKEGEEGTDEDAYDESYSRRNHRYDIHVEYHSASAVRFLKPNIIPGSEEVTLNGRRLVRDVDYIIDYDSGYIEFLVPGADSSDADLKIKYEYKPLFGEAGKTLAGGRLEFNLDDVMTLGGTYIGEWTDKPVDKLEIPELRSIPSSHQVVDADASLNVQNQFMTDFINLLPFIESKEESVITLEGEWAYSFYNPNRVGRAHVDDMESANQSISFPADGDEWGPSSPPVTEDGTYEQADRKLMKVGDEEWIRSQINGEWNEDVVRVLVFGADESRPLPQKAGEWDSVCRIISPNGLDLEEKNLKYLEFYLYRRGEINGGVLHFDIGLINEDSDGDYTGLGYEGYDTEDEGLHAGISDDLSDPGELDGRLNYSEDERGWTFNNSGDGGEYGVGGAYDEVIIGRNNSLLNTEDLDFNLTLDTAEQHFGYAVPLADIPEEYLGRDLGNGWLAIRIPLETDETRPGDYMPPLSKIVKAMRIWIEADNAGDFGPDENTAVLVYNLRLTGVRWEAPVTEPENPMNQFAVGTVNSEDNQDYDPLEQREDTQGFLIREQALDLTYNLVRWNDWGFDGRFGRGYTHPSPRFHDTGEPDSGEGDGILNTEDMNHNGILDPGEDIGWSGYDPDLTGSGNGVLDTEDVIRGSTAQEFLESRDFTTHDHLTVSINNRNRDRIGEDLFFIRFGIDPNNYYEAAMPLAAPGWNTLEVDFTRLIALRQEYDAFPPEERPATYTRDNLTVAGSPQLVRVYEVACGVLTTDPMSGAFDPGGGPGRVWVNNIDLENPVVREGQAQRGRLFLKFADVLTVEGSYQKVEGDFQSIGLRRTGVTAEDLDGAATLQLGAFMPTDWGIALPLTGSMTHSTVSVENIADYEGSVEDLGQTVSDTAKGNLTFSKTGWPTIGFAYTDYRGLNQTAQRNDHEEAMSASFDYSIISELFFVPTKVNARYLYKKDSIAYEEETGRVDTVTGKEEVTTSVTWQFIRGLSFSPNFSFSDTRDLLHVEPVSYTQNSGLMLSFSRFRLAQPSLDFGTTYSELFNPPLGFTGATYDVSVSNNFSASLPLSLGTLIEKWFGSWTTNLNYTLRRSSTYDEVTQKPPPEYVWGWNNIWHEAGEPTYSGRGYSYLISNRFRPLEFFRGFDDPELASYDVLLGEIKYSYSTDLSEAYGSSSRTWTEVWPAAELTITGHKYFPIFAALLQQSTVKLSFQKQTTKWIGVSLSRTYTPGISWRAGWSDDLSTTLSYTEASTITDESGSAYGIGDTHRVTNTYNPGASLTYVVELPGSFRVPFLGEDVPLRNELQLTASYNLTIVENSVSGSGQTPPDNTTRHTASLTGGYYLTTNIHANLTLTYEEFTNKTSVGYDYSSFDAKLALELKF
ncbi:MAG: hypothetical protein NTW26_08120 [bacterium]|nr:hypothetical protein [bacterium]